MSRNHSKTRILNKRAHRKSHNSIEHDTKHKLSTEKNRSMSEMMEIRCCCKPQNLLGFLPEDSKVLQRRQCNDDSWAFSSNERPIEEIQEIPGFITAPPNIDGGKKTWKKTWKK